jgi:hypothetical protein
MKEENVCFIADQWERSNSNLCHQIKLKRLRRRERPTICIVYYYSTQHNEFIYVKKDQANKEKYDCI